MIVRPIRALILAALSCAAAGSQAIELGIAAAPRLTVPVTSMKEIKFRTTTRQQFDFSCGSAALATLLSHHYGFPVTERAVFDQMYAHGDQQKIRREGFSLLDMQKYLASRGFSADGFQLPLEKLVEAKLPAIVLVSEKGYNHFVVIKGLADGRILIGDPSSGTRSLSVARFMEIWSSKLLFVIHGRDGATFNASRDWRAAPSAPFSAGVERTVLDVASLPRNGPGDF